MTSRRLRRIFGTLLALSAPVAVVGAGCGGVASSDGGNLAGGDASADSPDGGKDVAPPSCPIIVGPGKACISVWSIDVPVSCVPGADGGPVSLPADACTSLCGPGRACSAEAADAGVYALACGPACTTGRRPAGLELPACAAPRLGGHFARSSQLEAASVHAFRILRDELAAHGAPRSLVRAAERAARDEALHAGSMSALARRFGATIPDAPARPAMRERTLVDIAIENVVEGCVRETFGALVATHQARVATDPAIRAAMARIARDEARHAALGWQVARWLEARLDAEERARVRAAKREAIDELAAEARRPSETWAAAAGLPGAEQTRWLVAALDEALWSVDAVDEAA